MGHGARLVEWAAVGFVTNQPGSEDGDEDLQISVSLPGELYDPEPSDEPDGAEAGDEVEVGEVGEVERAPGPRVGGVAIGQSIELGDADAGDDADEELVVDLADWSEVARAAAEERLRESGVPHWWVGTAVHGSARDAAAIDEVLDEVEAEPDPLDPDEDQVAYDMSEWDDDRLATLGERLDEAEIPFAWDGDDEELYVYARDEDKVDALIEAVEHPDELPAEDDDGDEPDEMSATQLGDLFVSADRLQHDPKDHEQAAKVLLVSERVDAAAPPYGLDEKEWGHLCERVEALAQELDLDTLDEQAVVDAARDLRTSLRPYV